MTILLALLSITAQAAKINYHNGSTQYGLELDKTAIHFRSHATFRSIEILACNKEVIEKFWRETTDQALKYPRLTKLKSNEQPHVKLDDQLRLIVLGVKTELKTMDKEFILLEMRTRSACSRS